MNAYQHLRTQRPGTIPIALRYSITIFPLLILASGCQTVTIQVQRLAPPIYEIAPGQRTAVVDFQSLTAYPDSGRQVSTALVSALAPTGHFQLVERSQIAAILKEKKFSETFYVDDQNVEEMAKILNLDLLIVGEVKAFDVEDETSYKSVPTQVPTGDYVRDAWGNVMEQADMYGNLVPIPAYRTEMMQVEVRTRRGTVSVDYRVLDSQSGAVLVAQNENQSFNQSAEGANQIGMLPSMDSILANLTNIVAIAFTNKIAPHYVMETKTLERGKSPLTKQGVIQAQNNRWEEAIQSWFRAAETTPDDPAVFNNLGVAFEIQGDFAKAEENYRRASGMEPSNALYMQQLNHLEVLQQEYARLSRIQQQ